MLVEEVSEMAEVLVRHQLLDIAASEIDPSKSNVCEAVLKSLNLVTSHLGVTCNDSYGSNMEVLNICPYDL
ncbi:hypothetical protein SLA2020_226630 [Shorea laevis]